MAQWIKWMKENEVYDNTKIIIVSDHGAHWEFWKGEYDIDIPFKNIDEEKISMEWLLNLNPVLMVKDFNSKQPFIEDWRFMSNMDASAIAFDENNPTKGNPKANRTLPAFISWWSKDMDDRKEFSLVKSYEVKDNIFDVNNWKTTHTY
jgi:hypothetical protein